MSLFNNMESSAIRIGTLLLFRSPSSLMEETFKPVSGLISLTIFSKSRMMMSLPFFLMIPVATLSSGVEIVTSGLMIFLQDTLCIPMTASTWNAISNLLKFVMIKSPFFSASPRPRQFLRSMAVIMISRGIKIPSILG